MRYSELVTEVMNLGYKPGTLSEEELITEATNRALRDLFCQKKFTRTVFLAASGAKPTTYFKEIRNPSGKIIELPAKGKAFSMKIHGSVTYVVKDGSGMTAYSVQSPHEATLIRGVLTTGGSISVWSQFSFTIYDYAIYDQMFSEKVSDIPAIGPTLSFDIRKMYGDFLAFLSPPKDRYGQYIKGCRLHDGILEVDSSFGGEIILTYRRIPLPITKSHLANSADPVLDLPEEYEYFFAYLVMAYLYIDTDQIKYSYYRSLYDEHLMRITNSGYEEIDCEYADVNGWAG